MNALVPRDTLDAICAKRDQALRLFEVAHARLVEAAEAQTAAWRAGSFRSLEQSVSYSGFAREEKAAFLMDTKIPPLAEYLATARRLVDIDGWAHIVSITDLERLMDKQAKDDFRKELQADPPALTVDNVLATLEQLGQDAGLIFKRGVARCFSDLDRRFRSHDGWKIGARVILTNCFSSYGGWNYHRNERDTITDIERAFFVLDGRQPPAVHVGLVTKIDQDRRGGYDARQSLTETEFFRVRGFKNGNAHVWFVRDDLLEKVNKLLGEYYGAPLPEERSPVDDGGLFTPKTTLAKGFGFYPTPDKAADLVIEAACLTRHDRGDPPLTVLEPSAGTGSLARRAALHQSGETRWGGETWGSAVVDCVEIEPERANGLRREGLYRRVDCADFLRVQPNGVRLYDRVVMNPPFDRERDIDHVVHALRFLKPGGQLTAVMSAGTEHRDTRKSRAFRKMMAAKGAGFSDLPPGSFSASGTHCNTIIVTVRADGVEERGYQNRLYSRHGRAFEEMPA
jgi:hypothetical protein